MGPLKPAAFRATLTTAAVMIATLGLMLAAGATSAPAPSRLTFTTLGTNAGPIPRADRAEPANLLRDGDQAILVDAGDGAAEQLAKVGVPLGRLQAVVLSHLHFDHTAGLFAILSLRFQSRQNTPLAIYGPPGTRDLVEQLLRAMRSGVDASRSMGPALHGGPEAGVTIVELTDGSEASVGDIRVTAVENTHYDTLGPPSADRPVSLSFRFAAPGRSIVYTGDTGVSAKVGQLCQGADLLVSEIMDPALAIAGIRRRLPDFPEDSARAAEEHFRREHLAPAEVGKLAADCGVKTVVATHSSLERDELDRARRQIAAGFKGRIELAEDLQTF